MYQSSSDFSAQWDQEAKYYNHKYKHSNEAIYMYEQFVNVPSLLSLFPQRAERVLDIGCGNGIFTKILENRFKTVTGIDLSQNMINAAHKLCPNSEFLKHDIDYGFPEFTYKFNLIIAKLVLMYIKDLSYFVQGVCDNLTTNGSLLVSITHPIRWHMHYEQNKLNGHYVETFGQRFKGYFCESILQKDIGNDPHLKMYFIHRTLETYINTFRAHGFVLQSISEPQVPLSFMIEFPEYQAKSSYPRRLNMRFVKYDSKT
ncbi:class I SAM-dependent methyltransferase [Candidatus Dojkabacteria bacterium]|uniref:Class I SAM-dependent methyltransferase n=1 Tax=Candidatus Dojkabacteria bacterium TaxID=2099670 RepID=A0A955L9A3_9BACT|nr:class I SAM-dependent methyltransferase [Candidatus Dojkabacteria bacterium]